MSGKCIRIITIVDNIYMCNIVDGFNMDSHEFGK